MRAEETAIEPPAFGLEQAGIYSNIIFLQYADAPAAHFGEGIDISYYYLLHPLCYQPHSTWRCLAMMCTGLQVDIHSALGDKVAMISMHTVDAIDLGMCLPVLLVPAFTYDAAIVHQCGAHHGVRRCVSFGKLCQLQAA